MPTSSSATTILAATASAPTASASRFMRAEAVRVQQECFQGQGNTAGLGPGKRFRLESHPRSDQNRDYLVTAAEYCLQESAREAGEPGQGRRSG